MDHRYIVQWPDSWGFSKPSYFVEELFKQDIQKEVVEAILKTIDRTCKQCWDNPRPCYCWMED